MENTPLRNQILEKIIRKSNHKQHVFDTTFSAMNLLKESLLEMASELDDALEGNLDRRVRLEYRDRGKFECQLQIAGDVLIFQMQTDIYLPSGITQIALSRNPYIQEDVTRGYCGVINIYNFLSDSFKFNRKDDEGYLIGRMYVNAEGHYFVEGYGHNYLASSLHFGEQELNATSIVPLLEETILVALDFDPQVPPYDENLRVTVDQFNTKMDNSKFVYGKLIGHDFSLDNIGTFSEAFK
ncbi:MAG: hypothetical protein IIV06_05495 [Alistipes sp.]|nr:hypothetical protein [Alistipes sp.]